MKFWKALFGAKDSPKRTPQPQPASGIGSKRVIVCQNRACQEEYDLDHIVTVSDQDLRDWTLGGGATLIGNFSGHPVMVGHSQSGITTDHHLRQLLNSAPQVGWTCRKCQTDSSWNASYKTEAILRSSELKYYTGKNYAAWGSGQSKVFDPSEFDPRLPASSLEYLLDGTLYDIPKIPTPNTCRELVVKHLNEAATTLTRVKGTATAAEAAILTLMKLKLSLAVRNSEGWDSAESTIDSIIRNS